MSARDKKYLKGLDSPVHARRDLAGAIIAAVVLLTLYFILI